LKYLEILQNILQENILVRLGQYPLGTDFIKNFFDDPNEF